MFPPWSRRGIVVRRLFGVAVLKDPVTVLTHYALRHPRQMFVQIGANNGRTSDPLAPWLDRYPNWHGIMVEPLPQQFEELSDLRGHDPRFRLVRAAITEHDGTIDMNVIDGDDASDSLLASLHADTIVKHGIPRDRLRTVRVPAMTFATLVEGADRIDILCIDAEGHDAAILDQVDFSRTRPAVIMYEPLLLSTEDRERSDARLRAAGYRLVSNGYDTIGIRDTAIK
jgi:FkbM family methyltransferase